MIVRAGMSWLAKTPLPGSPEILSYYEYEHCLGNEHTFWGT